MPADPPLVAAAARDEAVRRIVAEVLMVPLERVRPEAALIGQLGAESLDFLDLVFRLEELLGRKIPSSRWQEFVEGELAGQDPASALTVALVQVFAARLADTATYPGVAWRR